MDIDKLPKLPNGLDYHLVIEELEPCDNCGGGVKKGGTLVAQSKRRKSDTFKKFFPAEGGFCLNCAKKQFGLIVVQYYDDAEQKITVLDQLRLEMPNATAVEQQQEIVDAITSFIKALGKILKEQREFEVDYVTPPFMDKLEDIRGVETPEETD